MPEVFVVGVGMTPFGKFVDRGLKSLGGEAVAAALEDSDVDPKALDLAVVGNAAAGLITGQECIRGQVILRDAGIGGLPIINVENACASGSTALHVAWQTIRAGGADVALALGVEKMTSADKVKTFMAFAAGVDVEMAAAIQQAASQAGRAEGEPADERDAGEQPKRSMFMDIYAALVRMHMQRYGTTREQMAMVAAKAHRFGSLNPYAQYRTPVTAEEVLADRLVAEPLTRMMCAPIGDGAAAAILMSEAAARAHGFSTRPRVLASVLRSATHPETGGASAEQRAIAAAYKMAGVGPSDLDVAEVHDATAPAEILAYEDLGLCETGEGGKLAEAGETDLGGRCPVNTSGGLVARGHPVGATGLAQVTELSWQLRGMCGERQVEGARVALAQNGGGFMGNDAAAQAVTILASGVD